MAFDLASDVERQIYRLRTLCLNPVLSYSSLVRAALPSVHSGSLARLQEVGRQIYRYSYRSLCFELVAFVVAFVVVACVLEDDSLNSSLFALLVGLAH